MAKVMSVRKVDILRSSHDPSVRFQAGEGIYGVVCLVALGGIPLPSPRTLGSKSPKPTKDNPTIGSRGGKRTLRQNKDNLGLSVRTLSIIIYHLYFRGLL